MPLVVRRYGGAVAELLPTFFLLTAFLLSLFYNGLDLVFYAVSGGVIALALGAAVRSPNVGSSWRLGPLGCLLLLLLAWTVLSQFWSDIPYLAATQAGVVAAAPAAYLTVRAGVGSRLSGMAMISGLVLLGFGFAVVMLAQGGLGHRPEGPYLNVNTAAATVNLFWPLLAALAIYPRAGFRAAALLILGVGVMAMAVGFSGGRAAALALLGSLFIFALCCFRWAPRGRLGSVIGAALAGLTVAQLVSRFFPATAIRGLGHRLATLADPAEAGATRFPIWEATAAMIAERPWLGWGPGSFFQVYPAHRAPADHTAGFHVHNDYLQYWVEGGLPAFLLVLALAVVSIWLIIRVIRHSEPRRLAGITAIAASAAIAGAGFHALFSYNLQVMPYLLILGIAFAALDSGASHPVFSVTPASIRSRPVPAVMVTSLLLASAFYFGSVAAARVYTERGLTLLRFGFYEPADEALHRAAAIWPGQDLADGLRGQVRLRALETVPRDAVAKRRTLKTEGFEYLDDAIELNPWRPRHHRIRAGILNQPPNRNPDAAEGSLRHALALNPRAASARHDLAELLRNQDRFDEALAVVNQGLGMFYAQNNPLALMRLGAELREKAGDAAGAERLREQIRERVERQVGIDDVELPAAK